MCSEAVVASGLLFLRGMHISAMNVHVNLVTLLECRHRERHFPLFVVFHGFIELFRALDADIGVLNLGIIRLDPDELFNVGMVTGDTEQHGGNTSLLTYKVSDFVLKLHPMDCTSALVGRV